MVRVVSAVFWGVRGPLVGDDPRSGEGELLKVVQGIEIRTASLDWKKRMMYTLDTHIKSMVRRFTTEIVWDNWTGNW